MYPEMLLSIYITTTPVTLDQWKKQGKRQCDGKYWNKYTNYKMETIFGDGKKKKKDYLFPLCGVENMQPEKLVSPKQYGAAFQTNSVASPPMRLPPLWEHSQWDILTESQLSHTKISSGLKSIKGHLLSGCMCVRDRQK